MAEHLTRNEKVVGSIPTISSKMNDPTQFEQVDETCGLGRVALCSNALAWQGFQGLTRQIKYETWKCKSSQNVVENE